MAMTSIRFFWMLVALLLTAAPAIAASITLIDSGHPLCEKLDSQICLSFALEGRIETGDAEKIYSHIEYIRSDFKKTSGLKSRIGVIALNSPGGDLYEAMEIGRLIRRNLIGTFIYGSDTCYSACVVAFLGGVRRAPIGKIGVHSFSSREFIGASDYDTASKKYNQVSRDVEEYLRELRIPVAFLDLMRSVPHSQLRLIDDVKTLQEKGIAGVDPVFMQMIDVQRLTEDDLVPAPDPYAKREGRHEEPRIELVPARDPFATK